MLDDNDSDQLWLGGMLIGGPIGLLLFVLWLFSLGVVQDNKNVCLTTKQCPAGMTVRLQNNECECVMVAQDKKP